MQVTTERSYGIPDVDATNWNSTFFDEFASKVDTDVQNLVDQKITLQVLPPGGGATEQVGNSYVSGYHGAGAFALTVDSVNKGYLAAVPAPGAFVSGSLADDVVLRTPGAPILLTFDDGANIHYKIDAGSMRSPGYVAGSAGWAISSTGDAEFNSIFARGGLSSIVINLSEVNATAGAQLIGKSAGSLGASYTTPASAPTTLQSVTVLNTIPSAANFAVNDVLHIRTLVGGVLRTAWFTITARTIFTKTTVYTCTFESGSTLITFPAGTAVVDLGPNPSGYITLSADGAFGPSANQSFFTHTGTPWASTKLVGRLGNLNGVGDIPANIYGVAFANDWSLTATTGLKGLMVDPTNGFRLWGCDIGLYNGATQTVSIAATGQARFGSNVAAPATTSLAIFPTAVTYNLESMAAGNVLLGDNTATPSPKANIMWQPSTGKLLFRGGVTTKAWVDTNGAITAGGGSVWIDDNGINTGASSGFVKRIKFYDDAWTNEIGSITTNNVPAGGSAGTYVIYQTQSQGTPPAFAQLRVTATGGGSDHTTIQIRQESSSSNSRINVFTAGSNVLTGVGIGFTAAPSAFLHIINTGEQFRAGYDTANYLKATVASSGATTVATVGTTAANAHLILAPASGAVHVDQSFATYAARHSGTAWGRVAAFQAGTSYWTENARYDGSNWLSDDTGQKSFVAAMGYNNLTLYFATAGSGARSLSSVAYLGEGGLTVGGTGAPTTNYILDTLGAQRLTGDLFMAGSGKFVTWGTGSFAAPTFTNHSSGTKLVLYDSLSGSLTAYAFGLESNAVWQTIPGTGQSYKIYSGTTLIYTLDGNANILIQNTLSAPGTTANAFYLYSSGARALVREGSDGARYLVQAAASTKTTAGAPYTNDGYVEVVINGTTRRLMTTA